MLQSIISFDHGGQGIEWSYWIAAWWTTKDVHYSAQRQHWSFDFGQDYSSSVYSKKQILRIKTIWMQEQLVELGISVVKIDTKLQWGDICTKMPSVVIFEFLRELIMGW